MDPTLKSLQDTLVVVTAIQERQAKVQKVQAEELDALRRRNDEMQRTLDLEIATREARMAEWDARIEKLVSGFGAFLAKLESKQ